MPAADAKFVERVLNEWFNLPARRVNVGEGESREYLLVVRVDGQIRTIASVADAVALTTAE